MVNERSTENSPIPNVDTVKIMLHIFHRVMKETTRDKNNTWRFYDK